MDELGIFDTGLVFEGERATLGGVLQNFGNKLQTSLRESLEKKASNNTSRQLWQSILFDVQFVSLGVYKFKLFMDNYGDFINHGVEGVGGSKANGTPWAKHTTDGLFSYKKNVKPSADHFNRWANTKGISPFAVREAVFHRGIKANHFYSDIVNDRLINDLVLSLESVGAKGVELELVDILTGKTK